MKRLLLLEIIITGAVFMLLLIGPNAETITKRIESTLTRIARKRLVAILGVIALAILLRAACLSFFPPPQPRIHDEFSYLLAADTFASGRVSNPAHPYWQFFESFHIIQTPTYASMYPPAQGLVLAFGKLIGHPWTGVLLSTALMCGLLCWMLQGWLPARWALIGGLIAVVRISLFSYWGNSYWGGSVAAIGGLLLLGSVPRLLKPNASIIHFLTLALGVLILANSRPYEGLLLCGAAGLSALIVYRKRLRELVTIKWLAVALTLLLGLSAMAFYNSRVTGNPTLMPYKVNEQQYAMAHAFLWQAPSTNIQYGHEVMKTFYESYYVEAERARSSISEFFEVAAQKMTKTWLFFIGPILSLPLIALPRVLRDKRIRFLVLTAGLAIPGILAETWFHAHYAAPFTGIIYAVLLQSIRHVRFSRVLAARVRFALTLTLPAGLVLITVFAVVEFPPPVQGNAFGMWCCNPNGPSNRSRLTNKLRVTGGRHLVFVDYTPEHNPNFNDEWVYNRGDLDASRLVFARFLDLSQNKLLIDYFPDRQVWRLVADAGSLKLERYEETEDPKGIN
jgi:hypothetical protein